MYHTKYEESQLFSDGILQCILKIKKIFREEDSLGVLDLLDYLSVHTSNISGGHAKSLSAQVIQIFLWEPVLFSQENPEYCNSLKELMDIINQERKCLS